MKTVQHTTYVPVKDLKKALDEIAWNVWVQLHAARKSVSKRVLAEIVSRVLKEEISSRRVKSALKKLGRFGLVQGGAWEQYGKYRRQAIGRHHETRAGWWLPTSVADTVRTHRGVGQYDRKAKKEGPNRTPDEGISRPPNRAPDEGISRPLATGHRMASGVQLEGHQVSSKKKPSAVLLKENFPLGSVRAGAREVFSSSVAVDPQTRLLILARAQQYLPKYPGPDAVGVIPQVPRPPQLDPDSNELDWAHTLAGAYRGCTVHHFGQEGVWQFWGKKGDLAKYKAYPVLVAAARAFLEHKIAPHAWADWKIRFWLKAQKRSGPPAVGMVFNAGKIDKDRGWFRSDYHRRLGGQSQAVPAHRELVRRWAQMDVAIRFLLPVGAEGVQAVVNKYLPQAIYDRLLAEARTEGAKIMRKLKRRAAAGEWIWT